MLRKAQTAGFFRDPVVATRVGAEKDFTSLHGRADFQKLLTDLTNKR
jgi:hypothetical protein